MRIRQLLLFSLAAFVLFAAGVARADLVIKITKGVNQPTPIAVVPFAWKGSGTAPVDVAEVVGNDLQRSGLFAPLAVSKMLAQPTARSDLHFANWRAVNVNYLVIGSIDVSGEQAKVRFRLFNVYTGQQLLGYILPTTTSNLRFTAHIVSNMVYKALTGTRGAFATRIAYIKELSPHGPWELVVADADGANAQVIVRSKRLLMSPDWSPDGKKVAYVQYGKTQSHIYIQNVATGKRREVLSRRGVNSAPVFSPNGSKLVVALSTSPGNTGLYILDIASGHLRKLTQGYSIDTEPSWMPGGNAIVFTSDRGGSPQIYKKSLDGGEAKRLSWNGSYNTRPVVAPDGDSIALVHRENGHLRVAMLDLASGNMKVLTNGSLDRAPTFSPNGALILYDSLTASGQHVLATVSVDSRVREELSGTEGGLSQPAWGPFPPHPPVRAAPPGT